MLDFSETTNFENGEVSMSVELTLKDYSGKISIVGFDKYAESLNEMVVVDAEYYVSKTNEQNDITASINNKGYTITLERI